MNIWVIDDDVTTRTIVRKALELEGMDVREFDSAIGVLESLDDGPDLLVLDVVMPGKSGMELCREIRAESDVPVLFLSARDEYIDRIVGLELGGDDYMTKPFHERELVARVRAISRRRPKSASPNVEGKRFTQGPISLDVESFEVMVHSEPLELTKTEFNLLQTLLSNPRKVFSRDDLMTGAYEDDIHVSRKTIDSHIRRLRNKFAPLDLDPVRTVRGVGYTFNEDI